MREETAATNKACNQEVVCVLGMHRSGTSSLARLLNLLGVHLGPDELLTTEPVAHNPRGYWEHSELTAISDAIIKRYGGSWSEPPILPPGWETDDLLGDLRQSARRLIRNQFDGVPLWGWKDPRTCLTLPFWQQLLPHLRFVICLRNPVDVARSLERRDGLSPEQSSKLWFTYVSAALRHSEGRPRLLVFYEDLLDDCPRELQRLADFLGKPEHAQQAEVQSAARQFIEKGMQHYRASIVDVVESSEIDLRARALYLAERISVSFGRKEFREEYEQAYRAIAAFSPAESLENAESEKDEMVQRLTAQLAAQARTLQSTDETVSVLAARLHESETELQKIQSTRYWRVWSRCGRIMRRFFSGSGRSAAKCL
jgi:hypothetical protein